MRVIPLNHSNLIQIAKKVPCPNYNRNRLKTGIVHIGVGGFHRSHQAYYIHQLLEKFDNKDWAICGVGLREADRKMYDILKKQDRLYTLTIQHPDRTIENEVIGSIKEMLLAVDTPDVVIAKMAHPDTKIVSLTITEGGYNFNLLTGKFNFVNKDIQHDLSILNQPKTVFGYLVEALRQRHENGIAPFSVLSCDNIPHNGNVARQMFLAFARKKDSKLADWIAKEVTFPNTMVDRITPVTSAADIEFLQNECHYKDEWPVICEPFIQWVVEDNFCNGRPPLEKLGVQFVPDVLPYEKMKIRLLNAGHSVLGIPGALHGHQSINDCMNDAVFAKFMREFMNKEATPVLDKIEGVDFERYKDSLEERFANPNIKDSVSRICSESSSKLPKFLIPTIQDNLARNGSIEFATFILAAWCYYSHYQVNENNVPLEIIDEEKDALHEAAKHSLEDKLAFLEIDDVFGRLRQNDRFLQTFKAMTTLVYKEKNVKKIMSTML
jgi:mannitol 2-dehydrogenase